MYTQPTADNKPVVQYMQCQYEMKPNTSKIFTAYSLRVLSEIQLSAQQKEDEIQRANLGNDKRLVEFFKKHMMTSQYYIQKAGGKQFTF